MKKQTYKIAIIAAALCIAGCAKIVTPGPNEANKREFEAWMAVNYPDKEASGLGIYILNHEEGDGIEVTDNGYALVNIKEMDLEGNISSYTDAETAKQLGTYKATNYYGPKFKTTFKTTLQAGLADAIIGMKAGGWKEVIVPSWLMTSRSFDTAKEYLDYYDEDDSPSYSDARYWIEVVDFTEDIDQWQIDSIGSFFKNPSLKIFNRTAAEVFAGMDAAKDTITTNGFYYKQIAAPETGAEAFDKDTTIYINYTGKLLNGLVFDTTVEKVAKENGLYSKSKTYGPVKIKWGEEYTDLTMGSSSSSVINGFALTLWQMKAMEKGVGVFYSTHGYGASGSGNAIPGYSPLIFEIEIVAEPE